MEARSQLQKGELKETLGEPRFSWKKKKKDKLFGQRGNHVPGILGL